MIFFLSASSGIILFTFGKTTTEVDQYSANSNQWLPQDSQKYWLRYDQRPQFLLRSHNINENEKNKYCHTLH